MASRRPLCQAWVMQSIYTDSSSRLHFCPSLQPRRVRGSRLRRDEAKYAHTSNQLSSGVTLEGSPWARSRAWFSRDARSRGHLGRSGSQRTRSMHPQWKGQMQIGKLRHLRPTTIALLRPSPPTQASSEHHFGEPSHETGRQRLPCAFNSLPGPSSRLWSK